MSIYKAISTKPGNDRQTKIEMQRREGQKQSCWHTTSPSFGRTLGLDSESVCL